MIKSNINNSNHSNLILHICLCKCNIYHIHKWCLIIQTCKCKIQIINNKICKILKWKINNNPETEKIMLPNFNNNLCLILIIPFQCKCQCNHLIIHRVIFTKIKIIINKIHKKLKKINMIMKWIIKVKCKEAFIKIKKIGRELIHSKIKVLIKL